ncbi:MAG: ABC transporter permease [Candidatus Woesearchaeota archaeon]
MMRVIYILWLRQMKRFFRSKSRLISSLAMPLLFLFALGFGFGPIYAKAGEGDYIQFVTPGIIAMSVLFTGVFSGIEIIWDKQFGFLKETLVAPVSRLDIMIGRTLGGATISVFQGLLVLVVSTFIGFKMPGPLALLTGVVFMFMIALLFTAIGTAIASVIDDMHAFQLIMNFLIMPLSFLSGAVFPLVDVPKVMQRIASFDPLSYGVDGVRWAFTGTSYFSGMLDATILVILTSIFLIIGAEMFSKIEI